MPSLNPTVAGPGAPTFDVPPPPALEREGHQAQRRAPRAAVPAASLPAPSLPTLTFGRTLPGNVVEPAHPDLLETGICRWCNGNGCAECGGSGEVLIQLPACSMCDSHGAEALATHLARHFRGGEELVCETCKAEIEADPDGGFEIVAEVA